MKRDPLISLCDKAISASFILLFFLVPLIFTPYNYELFEFNKMLTVYFLTTIILGSFAVKSLALGKIEITRTPLDIPIVLYLTSQILSTIFSIDRHISLFGYYSRFHGGLISTLCYIALFYIYVGQYRQKPEFYTKVLKVTFASSLCVAFYAVLQKLGIDKKIWIQDVQNRVFSSLGQPNWLAAYFSIVILLTAPLIYQTQQKLKKWTYLLFSLIIYAVIIFTKSRSGLLGLSSGLLFFALATLPAKGAKLTKNFTKLLPFLALLLVNFIFGTPFSQLNTYTLPHLLTKLQSQRPTTNLPAEAQSKEGDQQPLPPPIPVGTVLDVGITESGSIRKIVWQGALDIARAHPLLGTGVETFAFSYYKVRPVAHNATSEWDFLYNKAHNEYLNVGANTGFLGLASYLLLILVFLTIAGKSLFTRNTSTVTTAGLLGAYLSILVSNFFGFSVVIIGLFFFLIPAFQLTLAGTLDKTYSLAFSRSSKAKDLSAASYVIMLLILSAALYFLFKIVIAWTSDTHYNKGYQYAKANLFTNAYTELKKAVATNPSEPQFQDELAGTAAILALISYQDNNNQLTTEFKDEALTLSQTIVKRYPANLNFWKTRTRTLYTLSEIDPSLAPLALDAIQEAWKLAPNDAKIVYNTGLLYAKTGQTELAIETLRKATELKLDYYEPHFALALFYEQLNQKDAAIAQLNFILERIRPADEATLEKLKQLKN